MKITRIVTVRLVVRNRGEGAATVAVGGRLLTARDGMRMGYLRSLESTDLIVWLTARADKRVPVRISPVP